MKVPGTETAQDGFLLLIIAISLAMFMASLSFAMMGSGTLAGILYNRAGPKRLCIAAAIALAAGYFFIMQLHIGTPDSYVVISLALIGFGLGLLITPASNMVMNSVAKAKQGMVSSLTGLERSAPLTLGVAFFNMIFLWGIIAIAANHNITETSPVDLQLRVATAGFDLAFLGSFVLSIVILILTLVIRVEVHPDYQNDEGSSRPGMI
jgi:MFS family permease